MSNEIKMDETKKKERSKFMEYVIHSWKIITFGIYIIIFIPFMFVVSIILMFLEGVSWVLLQKSVLGELLEDNDDEPYA